MSAATIEETHRDLQQTWGLNFGHIRTLIYKLDTWHTQADLVDAIGLSHRGVGQVLRQLEPWLEKDDQRLRLSPQHLDSFRTAFKPQNPSTDPYDTAAHQHPALDPLTQILAARPTPDHHLDHVAATPATLIKRALYIETTYDLTDAHILCLGDHDLTSLALANILPAVPIAVVDVDDRLLAFIDETARKNTWNITTYFADFRLELPQSLATCFDLVFTDPPYSPDGVKLFLQRGIAALKDHPFARLLLAYGFGEQHPGLGYKVQTTLHELRLTSEAILPHFNHYHGARAIGAQSALYTLRPTHRSLPAATRIANTTNIYTHGRSAEEAQTTPPLADAQTMAQDWQATETLLVGDSWPKETWSQAKRLSLTAYLETCRTDAPPRTQNLALQLYPHFDPYLPRLLLTAQAQSLLAVVDRAHSTLFDDAPLRSLLECKYRLVDRTTKQNISWIFFEKLPTPRDNPTLYLLRNLADHPKARLANAWREALISWHKNQGTTLTKNQARELIGRGTIGSQYGQHYLTELPLHLLSNLVAELETTIKG